ncbi:MAG: EAL domain-containing protein [Gammaproteobacteria bacterium]|nr:EAL domain-containing protein [Gammaproteobacteria bacterium]
MAQDTNTSSSHKLGFHFIPAEILIHTLAAALVLYQVGARFHQDAFYVITGGFILGAAARIAWMLQQNSKGKPDTGRVEVLGLLLYGVAWGGTGFLALYNGATEHIFLLAAAMMAAIVASLAGAGLQGRNILFLAIPAILPSLGLSLYAGHRDQTLLWSLLMASAWILVGAGRQMSRLIERLQLVAQSNTDLVAKLAVARDAALKQQTDLERLNQVLNGEITERNQVEQRLRESEQELTRILDDMMDTYFHVDFDGNIQRLSPSMEDMVGESLRACMERNFISFFSRAEDFEVLRESLNQHFGRIQNHESLWKNHEEHELWVSFNAHFHEDRNGKPDGIEGIVRNTTEVRAAREALHSEKEWWRVTLESIADGVITTDLQGTVRYINPVAEGKTGWKNEDAAGKPLEKIIWLVDDESRDRVRLPIKEWLDKGKRASLERPAILIHRRDDNECVIELSGAPIRDSQGSVIGSIMVFHDVTKTRALATQLAYQATHDSLTGLINRIEFDQRVEQAIHSANKSEKVHVLFYIDLDQFKIVNDTCGHHAGDELLRQVTRLLRGGLREADTLARLGGDEFGVLLSGCPLNVGAEIAEKLRALVEEFRFGWEGEVFRIGASIGVVPITNAVTGLTELLSAADSACYVAKEGGRNRVHVLKPDDREVMEQHGQMQWMRRIQLALEHDHFALFSQPIVSVEDGSILFSELLLRMVDGAGTAEERLFPPSAFMPAAERYHLMPMIDRWVIRHAFQAMSLPDSRLGTQAVVTINLSGQSLGDLSLSDYVIKEIKDSGVRPDQVCFEITESAVISNMEVARQFVDILKEKGCRFALDDFGTGLSTFDYLKNLPVDFVKLDGILVRELGTSRVSQAMVHAINYVTHVMGMKSVAEFVENDAILDNLKKLKIDYAQGYGIGKPVLFYMNARG